MTQNDKNVQMNNPNNVLSDTPQALLSRFRNIYGMPFRCIERVYLTLRYYILAIEENAKTLCDYKIFLQLFNCLIARTVTKNA